MNRHPGTSKRSWWTLKTRQLRLEITDVQWVLGHAHLSTTQLYTTPDQDEVIASALAHHERRVRRPASSSPPPAAGYSPDSLGVLFGRPS